MIVNNKEIKDFGSLELLARQVVEGFLIGLHKSPFHGFSVEFAEHRIYNPGESTKNIDWKVYARTDKLFTKKFEEETNLRCRIVMDVSSSMYFPKDEENNKLRFSTLASAALMNLMSRQRDAFGLTTFDSAVRYHGPSKSKSSHFHMLLNKLEENLNADKLNKETSAVKVLHEIADSIPRRSLVIIFSDMLENPENLQPMLSALQHLKHNKHEVILFHVVDEAKELDFDFENRPYQFIDMETGDQVKLRSNQVKAYYKEKMHAFQQEVYLKCLQYKIDYVKADINKGFKPILQSFLVKRSKMRV
ncbi:MAG: DUF58 domain-containing protein [Saprospiraceae bacterium]|nr:DUF58 domain-containing protein [Saprospiraceae bacterium]